MTTDKSLWGDLQLSDVTRTPLIILREQATILTELTNGLLEGNVTIRAMAGINKLKSVDVEEPKEFNATLGIIAPALDGYELRIMQVGYNLAIYPVVVTNLLETVFRSQDKTVTCHNETEFVTTVGRVLSSGTVRQAISSMLAQSNSAMPA